MKIDIINRSKHELPDYQTEHAAAMDLGANIDKPIVLKTLERALIPTGIYIALPEGHELQIRPRSGLALKYGIALVNSPGTIDADYRGEIKVLIINLSNEAFTVNDGDRIAQMVVAKYETVEWKEVKALNETTRNSGGFGHTGV